MLLKAKNNANNAFGEMAPWVPRAPSEGSSLEAVTTRYRKEGELQLSHPLTLERLS